MNQAIENKMNFIKELNETISKNITNVESVSYEVFIQEEGTYPDVREFVKVNYVGGGYAVRNTSMDSCTAILIELARLLEGGYYDEVEIYKNYCNATKYKHYSSDK